MMKVSLQKILKGLAIGLIPAILFTGCESTTPKKNAPDKSSDVRKLVRSGTISVSGKSYALIVSGAWSRGVLHYQGKRYRIKAKSIGVGYSLGAKDIKIKGTVYNLMKLRDIEGRYYGVKAGATLGEGVGVSNLTNSKNVTLGLSTRSKGAAVDVAAGVTQLAVKLESIHPISSKRKK